jgi:cystathionine beta-lyase/cystathionine gamma-synthase
MTEIYTRLETQLVHAGAVEMPIFQSATYAYAGEARYDDVRYLRSNNTPSQLAVHAKLAVLEDAQAAPVSASGMAARCASFGCPTLLRPDTLLNRCTTL